ncbi:MAG: ZIP family metal transporter [Opitutales bacterium]
MMGWFSENPVWLVLFYASLTAVATGLGALPFLFVKKVPALWLGHGNAIASGLMLAASFNLLFEGLEYSAWKTMAGALVGLVAIVVSRKLLGGNGEQRIGELQGADAMKALLIVGVMTAHSFAEGIGVGVSFGESNQFGSFISLSIAVHNIPEGLAISLVLIPRGTHVLKAAGWSIFSSLPQPLMAVPAFLFVLAFKPWLPFGLGFAAGAMIWMVFSELLPESYEKVNPIRAAVTATLSILAMMLFQTLIH